MSFFEQIKSAIGKRGNSSDEDADSPPDERRRRSKRSSHKGRKILIIDDSTTVVASLGKILRSANAIVFEAFDAESGLEIAQNKHPDVIFLDIILPKMNGFSALRVIRRDDEMCNIPVIMVSGNEYATEQFYAKRIGADDFMKKPFSRHEIFARLDTLISAGKLADLGDEVRGPASPPAVQKRAPKRAPDLDAYRRSGSAISQSDETVGITPLEARRQLTAMGLEYFNQDQYVAAVVRGDKLAVDLFIVGGGVKVDL